MEYRKLKFKSHVNGYLLTCSRLFSMFSNLEEIDTLASEYEIDWNAHELVNVLLCGLGRNVEISYGKEKIVPSAMQRTNSVVVAFSGGKDSVATAMKLKKEGRDVHLFYVNGINKAYPDEMRHAKELAGKLELPIHVEYVSQVGKTSFKESPIKNQIIASMALNYAINEKIGTSVAFGDFTTDNTSNSQFFESWSDTTEMWNAWLLLVNVYIPNVELIIPFKTYNETLDIISENTEMLEMVCGCILPYRFRNMTRTKNEEKYHIRLLPNRCGSCWKCCTEYIFLADKGVVEINVDFYKHCLDFLVGKLPSVHPEITEINICSAYETFLHRDFKNSILNK